MPEDTAPTLSPAPAPRRLPSLGASLAGLLVLALAGGLAALVLPDLLHDAAQSELLDVLDAAAAPAISRAERARARSALLALPPAASAPRLARVLRRGASRWHTQVLPWLDAVPQLTAIRERQSRRERAAVEALQRMGHAAAPAVIGLLGRQPEGARDTAVALLRSYGTNVLPHLLLALDQRPPGIRAGAVVALAKFPSSDLGDLRVFRQAMNDPAEEVRLAAVWALGQFRDRPGEAVDALAAALADRSTRVRLEALRTLRPFAPGASVAVPALRRCLADLEAAVRVEAAITLAQLGPIAREARDDLLATMRSRRAGDREAAAAILHVDASNALTDASQTEEAFAHLHRGLQHPDVVVRTRSLALLSSLGSRARSAVPLILPLLDNDDPRDDRPSLGAVRNIDPEAIPERFRRRAPPAGGRGGGL